MLFAVSCRLYAVGSLHFAVCHWLFAVGYLLYAVGRWLLAICRLHLSNRNFKTELSYLLGYFIQFLRLYFK